MAWLFKEFHKVSIWQGPLDEEGMAIFDGHSAAAWVGANWNIPLIAIAIYVPIVFLGPFVLEAFDFHFKSKALTGMWSLSLSLFSMWGFARVAPLFFFNEHMGLFTQVTFHFPVIIFPKISPVY